MLIESKLSHGKGAADSYGLAARWKDKVNLQAAACTHTGALRTNNEDAFRYSMEARVFAVCDGMGGAAAGEVASRMAVDLIVECVAASMKAPRAAMEKAIAEANKKIFARAHRETALLGMGTTLVLVRVEDGMAHLAHIGDSRCYRWRGGALERLTQDHSLVDEQVRLGQLSAEEAAHSPYRNVITRALGTDTTVAADFQVLRLEAGDVLLLCTDGLTRELGDAQIAAQLAAHLHGGAGLDEACESLIVAANAAGGRDNITCLLIQCVE
jgi:serine/threonine protein phosphatase PrpC